MTWNCQNSDFHSYRQFTKTKRDSEHADQSKKTTGEPRSQAEVSKLVLKLLPVFLAAQQLSSNNPICNDILHCYH